MIETNIRNDSIDPRVESAFEAEPVQVAIDLQKGLLIGVSSILGGAQYIERQPQHLPIVAAHEQLESGTVTGLRPLNKRPVICGRKDRRAGRSRPCIRQCLKRQRARYDFRRHRQKLDNLSVEICSPWLIQVPERDSHLSANSLDVRSGQNVSWRFLLN